MRTPIGSRHYGHLEPLGSFAGHRLQHCQAQHVVIIDTAVLCLTRSQYRLLVQLLSPAGAFVSFERLLACLPPPARGHAQHARRNRLNTLYKQIYALKALLWPHGLDIVNLFGRGYLIYALETATVS